ncbi:Crp/Fnr family transcriptional regulator [Crenobacter caeni]|uniref:Crp/Fnr family transcriptional regulator n=1 Tax=Crenobacter caeni TaxID=2705474 RepID=A0A6B2KUV7_9NEIS|nr:Crp/Fnr family transcriptional regulator [Crenobacter caeni]NDV14045.1 Crp/Fnr family transcriptional regulator [Crenobacter caeni]
MLKTDQLSLLSHLPLFRQLNNAQLARLAGSVRMVHGERGKLIFQRGDSCVGFYIVVYGRVKLAISNRAGVEKIIEIFTPGQSFGEAALFAGQGYPANAEFLDDGLLLLIQNESIDLAMESDPQFARTLLAGLSMRLHGLIRDVERYSIESSAQRVIGYLLQELPDEADDHCTVCLTLSKNVIASRLNLTPETFSRVLSRLSQAGLIEVVGRYITLHNPKELSSFGCE